MKRKYSFEECEHALAQAILHYERSIGMQEYEAWRVKQGDWFEIPASGVFSTKYGSFQEAKKETASAYEEIATVFQQEQEEKERLRKERARLRRTSPVKPKEKKDDQN